MPRKGSQEPTKLLYFTGSNQSSWKKPQEISDPNSCSEQVQPWGQTELLRPLSRKVLKSSYEGDCPASLDPFLAVLNVKKLLPISSRLNLSFQVYKFCLSSSCHAPQWRAWLQLLAKVPAFVSSSLFPRLNHSHFLSLSSQGKCTTPNHRGDSSLNVLRFSLISGPRWQKYSRNSLERPSKEEWSVNESPFTDSLPCCRAPCWLTSSFTSTESLLSLLSLSMIIVSSKNTICKSLVFLKAVSRTASVLRFPKVDQNYLKYTNPHIYTTAIQILYLNNENILCPRQVKKSISDRLIWSLFLMKKMCKNACNRSKITSTSRCKKN